MLDDRSPLGYLIAALGAAVLAISVFLPWYGVTITASGVASAQQELATVAQQYGNPTFQAGANQVGAQFDSLAGRQLATVNAHQVLKDVSRIVLLLAGIALLVSLLNLAGLTEGGGTQVAVAGSGAALFALYRMFLPPGGGTALVSLSLSWGSWLALLSAAAIVAGGVLAASSPTRRRPAPSYGQQI
jgi:hypothetical protein